MITELLTIVIFFVIIQKFLQNLFLLFNSVKCFFRHPEWSYVHRLDLVTSGLLIGSCDTKVRRQLSMAIEDRLCKKLYLALVYGNVKESWFGIHHPINHNRYLSHAYTQFQSIFFLESRIKRKTIFHKFGQSVIFLYYPNL